MLKKPELLAPAGDYQKLIYAVEYGADAVYIGGEEFSLRTASANFSLDEIDKAVRYAHSKGVRVYVACNSVPRNDECERFIEYVKMLEKIGVDAVIVSDLGFLALTREHAPNMAIHISTQANTLNYETCKMWHKLGAKRVVLAREVTMDEITEIRQNIPDSLELETFVHGAMCMSHSGRCLISNFLTSRDANHGNCAQSCRWEYSLMEQTRPGQYFPVFETDTGTFIMNAKDLCMIEHLPELCNAGVNSFKIEGRVKTEYYVASVTNTFRQAIDDCFDDVDRYVQNLPMYVEDLNKISHREYYTGFFFGDQGEFGQNYTDNTYIRDWELVGVINGYDSLKRRLLVTQKNKFCAGDTLEILEAGKKNVSFVARELFDDNGEKIFMAQHASMNVEITFPSYVSSHSFLRRKK